MHLGPSVLKGFGYRVGRVIGPPPKVEYPIESVYCFVDFFWRGFCCVWDIYVCHVYIIPTRSVNHTPNKCSLQSMASGLAAQKVRGVGRLPLPIPPLGLLLPILSEAVVVHLGHGPFEGLEYLTQHALFLGGASPPDFNFLAFKHLINSAEGVVDFFAGCFCYVCHVYIISSYSVNHTANRCSEAPSRTPRRLRRPYRGSTV